MAADQDGGKETATAVSPFVAACVEGNKKYIAHDVAGALEALKRAIALAPENPLGHALLGEIERGRGAMADAESAWKTALEKLEKLEKSAKTSAAPGNPQVLNAHVLFAIADLKEREKKWDEARVAWQAYSDYAVKHPEAGAYPQTASSRLQVIDDMLRQDRLYEPVRQRIAAEKAANAAAPPRPGVSPKPVSPKK